MLDPYRYPKLRWPIEIQQQRIEGQDLLVFFCPIGITKDPLVLVAAVGPIISVFQGEKSVAEIAQSFSTYGVTEQLVNEIVALLDKHSFLATPKFFAAERAVRDEFSAASLREAALAGRGYASVASRLREDVDGFLRHRQGSAARGDLFGLVAPHIDYRRGGPCYGTTYNFLRKSDHDFYLLIGTAHQYSKYLFHLTRKDFASPLGTLPCDRDFVDRLAALYGSERSFADEFLHKREHSLELQLPFLKRLKHSPKIVPILVGGFHQYLVAGKNPREFDEYESFAASLTECLRWAASEGRRVCFLAAVDMAHIGRAFGDPGELTPEIMERIERRDRIYLEMIKCGDKEGLFAHIAEDMDARRICGFPTMYTLLDVFERLGMAYRAEIFDYRQAVDYTSDCAVTFAGVGLYR